MVREDLVKKRIDNINSMEQAMELIGLLEYDECIAALKGVKRMPDNIYKALIERAKSLRGITVELIIAGMQGAVNC